MLVAEKYLPIVAKLKEECALYERQLAALYADRNDATVRMSNTPSTDFLIHEFERRLTAIAASLKRFGAHHN